MNEKREPLTLEQLREMLESSEIVGAAVMVLDHGVECCGVLDERADDGICVSTGASDEWLKELVEADKDGRCVVLPFKPPKMAWTCNANDPKPVKAFYSSAMGIMADMKAGCVFGDTPEAAEAALKAKSEG